jgi:predicted ATPase
MSILQNAPGVKLLITSRERLNLREEWAMEISGLDYPERDWEIERLRDWNAAFNLLISQSLESYSAVALFTRQAQRVRGEFLLTAAEAPSVVRICQLVEGFPLALELAAGWLRVLSCAEIVQEIEGNLDFLSTAMGDMPERHRSLRTVFVQSWQRLSVQEQTVFRQLSVFRGGFQREAAQAVAAASLPSLTSLVDKSLLRLTVTGRYEIQELLRQFAAEQLAQSPDEQACVYERHCTYYADFLEACQQEILSGQELEVIAKIEAELENVRAAWEWATIYGRTVELDKASPVLSMFYRLRNRYQERLYEFERAIFPKGGRSTSRRAVNGSELPSRVDVLREDQDSPGRSRPRLDLNGEMP